MDVAYTRLKWGCEPPRDSDMFKDLLRSLKQV